MFFKKAPYSAERLRLKIIFKIVSQNLKFLFKQSIFLSTIFVKDENFYENGNLGKYRNFSQNHSIQISN